MTQQVVLDASVIIALFINLPYSEQAEKLMTSLSAKEAVISAPILWEYECLSVLRRGIYLGQIDENTADRILLHLSSLELDIYPPTLEIHRLALRWAAKLGQSKAYDAHYLALAETLNAVFYTADAKLYHKCTELGVNFIQLVTS